MDYNRLIQQVNSERDFIKGNSYHRNQDYKKAFKWYMESALQGHCYAQLFLGQLYSEGKGVEKDIKQAIYWWEKSAEQKEPFAYRSLFHLYYEGKEIKKDYKKAIYWGEKLTKEIDFAFFHRKYFAELAKAKEELKKEK